MKIVFAGSPEFAVPALNALLKAGKNVIAVITQPDKPMGRKQILTPTPVKKFAAERGLPVYEFKKIRENVTELTALNADIMITCAYGQLLTQEVLNCFKSGVWNIHASLLPEFRGASPVQAAVLAGKTHTGVTVMKTELSLDTGDMLLVKRCEIGNMTCGELTEMLSELGGAAAVEAVGYLEAVNALLLLQDNNKATYCKKINKPDCKIDFNQSAQTVFRKIKAFSPEPAAFCMLNGENLNLFNAELAPAQPAGKCGEVISADKRGVVVRCGEGAVSITELQLFGGKRMRAADAVNGRKIKAGDILE